MLIYALNAVISRQSPTNTALLCALTSPAELVVLQSRVRNRGLAFPLPEPP